MVDRICSEKADISIGNIDERNTALTSVRAFLFVITPNKDMQTKTTESRSRNSSLCSKWFRDPVFDSPINHAGGLLLLISEIKIARYETWQF